jgi:hypothetical protein
VRVKGLKVKGVRVKGVRIKGLELRCVYTHAHTHNVNEQLRMH